MPGRLTFAYQLFYTWCVIWEPNIDQRGYPRALFVMEQDSRFVFILDRNNVMSHIAVMT